MHTIFFIFDFIPRSATGIFSLRPSQSLTRTRCALVSSLITFVNFFFGPPSVRRFPSALLSPLFPRRKDFFSRHVHTSVKNLKSELYTNTFNVNFHVVSGDFGLLVNTSTTISTISNHLNALVKVKVKNMFRKNRVRII